MQLTITHGWETAGGTGMLITGGIVVAVIGLVFLGLRMRDRWRR